MSLSSGQEGSGAPSSHVGSVGVELNLWPHGFIQEAKANILVGRITGWKAAIDALFEYFKYVGMAEKYLAESMSKVQKTLAGPEGEDFGSDFGGTVGGGLHDMMEFARKAAINHAQRASFVDPNLKKLEGLKREISKDAAGIVQEIEKLRVSLRLAREDTLHWISAYEKACKSFASPEGGSQSDPWMLDLKIKEMLKRLSSEENKFNTSMIEFHKELTKIDQFLSESLKDVLAEYSKKVQKQTGIELEMASHLNQRVSLINPTEEFSNFATRNGLDDTTVWEKVFPADGSHIDYPFKDGQQTTVLKIGTLKRQGKVIKGNWKDAFFVLTECGFLHCFKSKTIQKSATKDGEAPFAWTPNPAFGGGGSTGGALGPRKPSFSFNIYDCVEDMVPEFSINLRNTVVSASSHDNITNYAFEILVPPSKALFSTESRHIIKATSEEEMVDWFVAIKAKAHSPPVAAPAEHEKEREREPEIEKEPLQSADKEQGAGKDKGRKLSSFKGLGMALFGRDKKKETPLEEKKPTEEIWTSKNDAPQIAAATEAEKKEAEPEVDDDKGLGKVQPEEVAAPAVIPEGPKDPVSDPSEEEAHPEGIQGKETEPETKEAYEQEEAVQQEAEITEEETKEAEVKEEVTEAEAKEEEKPEEVTHEEENPVQEERERGEGESSDLVVAAEEQAGEEQGDDQAEEVAASEQKKGKKNRKKNKKN